MATSAQAICYLTITTGVGTRNLSHTEQPTSLQSSLHLLEMTRAGERLGPLAVFDVNTRQMLVQGELVLMVVIMLEPASAGTTHPSNDRSALGTYTATRVALTVLRFHTQSISDPSIRP